MADGVLIELPGHIAVALSLASASTGTDYHYLVKTAERESSFRADARASTSSAEGLFQFIEETWIRTIKEEGERYGLKQHADRIVRDDNGRYVIANPVDRAAILALRKDPRISALMAGAYARRNAEYMASSIGRKPTAGELYMAHFLGPTDAVKLIQVRDTQPSLSAPDLFPRAAEANRSIFYSLGQPLSVGTVYERLIGRQKSGGVARLQGPEGGVTADFGSWKPEVERAVSVSASGPARPMLGNAQGFSLFDALFATPPAVPEAGWDATVATNDATTDVASLAQPAPVAAAKPAPKPLKIRVPGKASLLRGGVSEDGSAAVPRAAEAPPLASSPRLKIIHVPSDG